MHANNCSTMPGGSKGMSGGGGNGNWTNIGVLRMWNCAGRLRCVVGYVSAIGASLTRALWLGALRCTSTEASRKLKPYPSDAAMSISPLD
jgi:hypothetical protein